VESITFQFDKKKAVETIVYLVARVKNPDVYSICKLIYLADKTNLEKYGRFIFGEQYCAMKEGATPSNAYDLIKEGSPLTRDAFEIKGHLIVALREANLDFFSQSDIESLDQIIKIYEALPNWRKREDAHDAAWKFCWGLRGSKRSVPIPVEKIIELFDDNDDLISYLKNIG